MEPLSPVLEPEARSQKLFPPSSLHPSGHVLSEHSLQAAREHGPLQQPAPTSGHVREEASDASQASGRAPGITET